MAQRNSVVYSDVSCVCSRGGHATRAKNEEPPGTVGPRNPVAALKLPRTLEVKEVGVGQERPA